MSRVDHQLRYAVMGMLGSLWSRSVTSRTKDEARAVVTLAANAGGLQRLETPVRKLTAARRAVVEDVWVGYLEGEFAYSGPDVDNFWRADVVVDGGPAVTIARFAATYDGTSPRYAVAIPAGLSPVVIATRERDRVLVNGIDFESRPGAIVLRESPGDVFAAGGFTVLHGYQDLPLPYNYPMRLNGSPYGHSFVASYYRGGSSVTAFAQAAAQACGLLVIEQDDTLVHLHHLAEGVVRYVFAVSGPLEVTYPHALLEVGRDYPRGHIVSDGFSLARATTTGWLKRAVGADTFSLDGVLPVKGLSLPPSTIPADYVLVSDDDRPHARLHFAGSDTALADLWETQRQHELRTGNFLADTLLFSAGQTYRQVDFHTLLEVYYGPRLLLLRPQLEQAPTDFQTRLLEFVTREKPLGAVILIQAPHADTPAGPPPTADNALLYNGAPLLYNGAAVLYTT